jgi:hypothetical protein
MYVYDAEENIWEFTSAYPPVVSTRRHSRALSDAFVHRRPVFPRRDGLATFHSHAVDVEDLPKDFVRSCHIAIGHMD